MKLPPIPERTKSFCGALLFIAAFIVTLMLADIDPNISNVTITYEGTENGNE